MEDRRIAQQSSSIVDVKIVGYTLRRDEVSSCWQGYKKCVCVSRYLRWKGGILLDHQLSFLVEDIVREDPSDQVPLHGLMGCYLFVEEEDLSSLGVAHHLGEKVG